MTPDGVSCVMDETDGMFEVCVIDEVGSITVTTH